jgi:hypothetical protein
MHSVYLDLNKWIDVARALNGDPRGKPFEDAATLICAASDRGQASFPLSMEHFLEVWKRRSIGPRFNLAKTMAAISRTRAIAPWTGLLPGEIDHALQRRFGRPTSPRPLRPFGWGISHLGYDSPPEYTPEMRAIARAMHPELSEHAFAEAIDGLALSGSPVTDIDHEWQPTENEDREFAANQNELMRLFREHNIDKDERRRHLAKEAFEGIARPLDDALALAGLSWNEFFTLDWDGITDFILDLPSQMVTLELIWRQCDNLHTKWKPNDLKDIGFLAVAVSYCDIVVTERPWTHMLNQSGVAKRTKTTVISNVADVTELLVAASVAT